MSQSVQNSDEELRTPSTGVLSSEREVLIQRDSPKHGVTAKATHTIYVYLLTMFAALGGFLFGYDTGVVSGAMLPLAKEFSLSDLWKEFVVSITIAAAIIGTIIGGFLNDKFGRKPVLLICSAVFTAGALVMGVSRSKEVLLLGRGIVGLGIGGASMTVPLYIAESTPTSIRGQLITMNNLFITGGQFIACVIDGLFSKQPDGWRYMLGLAGVPSIIMFFGCLALPESPRWLVKKKKMDQARQVVKKLFGTHNVEEEIQSVLTICQEEEEKEKAAQGEGVCMRMLMDPNTRRALLVGCMLQAVQQLSGINTVMYYSATIIFMSGIGTEDMAIWLAAAIGFGNFIFTIVGLLLVEKVGRRKLLLGSLAGVILSLFVIGGAFYLAEINDTKVTFTEAGSAQFSHCVSVKDCLECIAKEDCGFCYQEDIRGNFMNGSCVFTNVSDHSPLNGRCSKDKSSAIWTFGSCPSKYAWLAVLGLILYIATFAPGIGPMPWTLNSEIFPLWARSKGNSCTTAVNWTCNLIIAISFLHLMKLITRPGAFWLYGSIAFAGWIFFYIFVPETKGKSLEELETIMISSSRKFL